MSISALSGDTIEKRGLVGMDDYLRILPGISMQDRGAGQNSIVIRGIASDPQTEDSTAGVYFGETPLSELGAPSNVGGAGNADIKLVDVERVEVLRGPQGTLYGSGSLGGTVRVIPSSPNLDQLEGKLATRYSRTNEEGDNNTMIQGVLNVPLIEGKLAIRGVAYQFDNSGYIENVAASQPSVSIDNAVSSFGGVAEDRDDVGNDRNTGFRLTTKWQPIEPLDITLTYTQQEIEQKGTPEVNLDLSGDYQQRRLNTGIGGSSYELLENDIDITNLVVNYDFEWGRFTSSSSWINYESSLETDFSHITALFGLADNPYFSDNTGTGDIFVEELRLASKLDGPFQFIVGLYYEDKETGSKTPWRWSGDSSLDTGIPLQSVVNSRLTEQTALFGELSYSISEKLTATIGGRYFDYDREDIQTFDFFGIRLLTDQVLPADEKGETFKFNLSYTPTEDTLLYGQWAEGFRLGKGQVQPATCQALGITAPNSIDSDTSENFELGVKTFLANKLTLNAALYFINWKGLPVVVTPAGTCAFLDNAGEAKSEGVELEIQAHLAENLQMDISASYGEATLAEDALNLGGRKGDNLPGSSDYNISLGLQYGFTLAQYSGFARIDYTYISEYYNSFSESGKPAGGFDQINFKTGINLDQINLDLYVNNLTNDDGLTWVESVNVAVSGINRANRIRPRTIGLNLSYDF